MDHPVHRNPCRCIHARIVSEHTFHSDVSQMALRWMSSTARASGRAAKRRNQSMERTRRPVRGLHMLEDPSAHNNEIPSQKW